MSEPAVSVVMPSFNRAELLPRAIRSVLLQTFRDFELIVVDDGSTDNSAEVVASFSDPRLRYLRQDNRGAAVARNAGIRAAHASLIAFQDSDDEWLADKLEAQVETFRQSPPQTSLVCGGYLALSATGGAHRYWGPDARMQAGDWQADNIFDFCFITPTWLASKQALLDAGLFDEQMPNLEDWELSFRLFRQGPMFALDKPLVVKHGGASSLNFAPQKRIGSLRRIIELHGSLWAQHPRPLAQLHDELGRLLSRSGDTRQGRMHLLKALSLDSQNAARWAHTAAALGGPATYGLLRQTFGRGQAKA